MIFLCYLVAVLLHFDLKITIKKKRKKATCIRYTVTGPTRKFRNAHQHVAQTKLNQPAPVVEPIQFFVSESLKLHFGCKSFKIVNGIKFLFFVVVVAVFHGKMYNNDKQMAMERFLMRVREYMISYYLCSELSPAQSNFHCSLIRSFNMIISISTDSAGG